MLVMLYQFKDIFQVAKIQHIPSFIKYHSWPKAKRMLHLSSLEVAIDECSLSLRCVGHWTINAIHGYGDVPRFYAYLFAVFTCVIAEGR